MRNEVVAFAFIFLTSFTNKEIARKVPNGKYLVELDKKYKNLGLNDFDFTLGNEKFITKKADKYEILEINWIDEKTFIVKGLTEQLNPNEMEKNIMKESEIAFRIIKQEKKNYYFTLGEASDIYPIYSGKFIKNQ